MHCHDRSRGAWASFCLQEAGQNISGDQGSACRGGIKRAGLGVDAVFDASAHIELLADAVAQICNMPAHILQLLFCPPFKITDIKRSFGCA